MRRIWHREIDGKLCQCVVGGIHRKLGGTQINIFWQWQQRSPRTTSSRSSISPSTKGKSQFVYTFFPKTQIMKNARVRPWQQQFADEIRNVTFTARQSSVRSLQPTTRSSTKKAEQSEVCTCGTRLGHPHDSKLPIENQNFTRIDEKSTEVSRSRGESKGQNHRQSLGIRTSLWRTSTVKSYRLKWRKTLKKARRKLNVHVRSARCRASVQRLQGIHPWKAPQGSREKNCDDPWQKRARQGTHTNFDAHESTRKRTTETQNINNEDSFLWVITILCTSSFLCTTLWRPRMRRPRLTKSGTSWRKNQHGRNETWKANQIFLNTLRKRQNSSLCIAHGLVPPQKLRIGQGVQKRHRTCCATWRLCEWWLTLVCRVHRAGIFRVTHDSRQSSGCHFQTFRVHRTSSWCRIGLYAGQNGRCTIGMKNSQIGMSRYLDSSTKTRMTKIMVQYGKPSRSSRKEFARSRSGRTLVGKAIRERSFGKRLGKVSNWECLFVNQAKGLILFVSVDDIKMAGKTEDIEPT